MKLAPPHNTLQPLPSDIQPAVSQSVQRTASQNDIQAALLSQQSQNITPGQVVGQQTNISPIAFSSGAGAVFPWVGLVLAVAIVAGGVWFWRTF